MINVILPTYNEAQNICAMLKMLNNVLEEMRLPYLVIVIDDNSPDGTSKIVKNLNIKNCKIIDRAGKLGLGSAYLEGLKHCKFEYTFLLDADLQHDPFSIPLMFKTARDYDSDIVSGTRYAKSGMVCNWSFMRKFISMGANTLARYVLGISSTDLTGSFRCYKTSILKEIVPKTICKGFGFQMEMIARAELEKKKISEVPIIFYDRMAGLSKLGPMEIVNFVKTILILYFKL
jgi:dolichol-phosphate mannosyltransferase